MNAIYSILVSTYIFLYIYTHMSMHIHQPNHSPAIILLWGTSARTPRPPWKVRRFISRALGITSATVLRDPLPAGEQRVGHNNDGRGALDLNNRRLFFFFLDLFGRRCIYTVRFRFKLCFLLFCLFRWEEKIWKDIFALEWRLFSSASEQYRICCFDETTPEDLLRRLANAELVWELSINNDDNDVDRV